MLALESSKSLFNLHFRNYVGPHALHVQYRRPSRISSFITRNSTHGARNPPFTHNWSKTIHSVTIVSSFHSSLFHCVSLLSLSPSFSLSSLPSFSLRLFTLSLSLPFFFFLSLSPHFLHLTSPLYLPPNQLPPPNKQSTTENSRTID